jgi:uncharacterized protein YndB with AHSA1/START domain
MIPDRLERDILIEAPVEVVWAVVTEPEHLGGWFGDSAEIELRPGGRLVLTWEEHGSVHGRVERVEPPRLFSFRWIRGSAADGPEDNSTLVEFSLREDGDTTRLTVVESGFRGLSGSEKEKEEDLEDHRSGWELELDELRDYARRPAGTAAGG